MNSSINFSEILIVDGAGIFCLLFLLYIKFTKSTAKRIGERFFCRMIWVALSCLVIEILSFYIDGRPGQVFSVLQYLTNGGLYLFGIVLAFIWCMFAEFKLYHSLKRNYQMAKFLVIPVVVVFVAILCDCFGANLLFSISDDNVYTRGRLFWAYYLLIFFYYIFSVVFVHCAQRKGNKIFFFPVYTFIIPNMIGIIVQGLEYGNVASWFSIAVALLFLEIQMQKEEGFVDELTGVYNRKYLEFSYKYFKSKKDSKIHGIMMDLNLFKQINDTYGHTVGDDALRTVSRLISQWIETSATLIRFAGDEFIILCHNMTEEEIETMIANIKKGLEKYNSTSKRKYQLSLSIGYTEYTNTTLDEFLYEMDKKMYEDKERFRETWEEAYQSR